MPSGTAVILNVDDNEPVRYVRSRVLRGAGLEVREASTGTEALESAATHPPDLVLLDVNLPDISGFDVCRRLRASPVTANVPVIHISAEYGDSSTKLLAAQSGSEVYLTEPVEPEALVASVISLLKAVGGRKDADALLPAPAPASQPRPRGLVAATVPPEVLDSVVSDLMDLLGTSTGIFEADGEYVTGEFQSAWCRLLSGSFRVPCPPLGDGMPSPDCLCRDHWVQAAREAIATGHPVDAPCAGGIRTFSAPIFAGAEVIGAINLGYGDPPTGEGELETIAIRHQRQPEALAGAAAAYPSRPPSLVESAKRRLTNSARLIGAIVEQKRAETALLDAYRAEQEAADRLRRLQAITAALGEAVTTDQVLDAVIARVMEFSGALTGFLMLLDQKESEFTAARISGYPPEMAARLSSRPVPLNTPLADAALSGEVVLLESSRDPRYPILAEADPGFPTGGLVAMPIRLQGRIFGALALRLPLERKIVHQDREFFLTVGRECAQALERARLYDAEARSRQALQREVEQRRAAERERERLLAEVTGQNRRLEEIFGALPAYVAMYAGPQHVLVFSNPENVGLWGGRNPLGKPFREAYPEVGPFYFDLWDEVFHTGEPRQVIEMPAMVDRGRGGPEETFLSITLLPRRDNSGEVSGVLAFGVDVTRQVLARRDLETQGAFMEAVLNQLPLGVAVAEAPEGKLILFNEQGLRILGRAAPHAGEIAGHAEFQLLHPDGTRFRPEEHPLARARHDGEVTDQREIPCRRGDGSIITLSISAAPIRDARGRIVAGVSAFVDFTGRREERETLRRQSELIDLSRDAIVTATPDRVITGWNPGAEDTYGWTAAEAAGQITHRLLATSSLVPPEEIDAALMREGRWDGELLHTRKDGAVIVVDSRQVLIRNERGEPAGFLEINRDITGRKRAEEALRESEQWLKFSQDATGLGMRDWDLATNVSRCSEQFARLYGLDPERRAITCDEWITLVHPDDREAVTARIAAALEGRVPYELEFRALRPDGAMRWIGVKGAIFRNAAGKALRVIGAHFDITERKAAEEVHHSAQKLESIGLLAGGIAHDFNNLLTGVLGNASLVQSEAPPQLAERIEAIITGAQKAADLTRQLLAYAGKGRFVVRELDLSAVVREMTGLLRVSIPKHIELKRTLHPVLVKADAGQIQQVVMNLAINAAEAIGEAHGTVLLSTGVREVAAPLRGSVGESLEPGMYACIEARDTGAGMDPETRARIFDPFFSTKFVGRGMGLAAVAGIVRSHQGAITVESEPGNGSTFRVLLPAVAVPQSPRPAVLVVDDEASVRDFIERVLERRGYCVYTAADGREALALLEQHGREISLVVLDVVMPVMGGGETLTAIRERRPDLEVLLTSGYSEDEVERLCGGSGKAEFIQKPYTAQQLADKVAAVIGE